MLMVVVIALAFAVGVLWQKVSDLSKPSTGGSPVANNNAAAVPQAPTSGKLEESAAAKLPLVSSLSESVEPSSGQALREKDHLRGSKDAQVLLIEYSDFQCPYCASFHPTAQKALAEYGDKLAWAYRHFPLDSIHPSARPAANASECMAELVGEEGFWKFADEVFANPAGLTDLSATAVKLGVNKAAFDACLSEKRYDEIVNSDYQEGIDAGVAGTPGNYIVNSKGEVWKLPGAVPYESLKQTIEEALSS